MEEGSFCKGDITKLPTVAQKVQGFVGGTVSLQKNLGRIGTRLKELLSMTRKNSSTLSGF